MIWPLDMPPGADFIWLYFALVVALPLVARALQHVLGASLDDAIHDPPPGANDSGAVVRVDAVPHGEAVFLFAYAAGGRRALEESMCGAAVAANLVIDAHGKVEVVASALPDAAVLRSLQQQLRATTTSPRTAVTRALDAVEPAIERDLLSRGVLRPVRVRALLALVPCILAAALLALGALRVAYEQEHFPAQALDDGLLAAFSAAVVFMGFAIALTAPRRSAGCRRWVRFVVDDCALLRAEVQAGRRTGVDDVALACAVDGVAKAQPRARMLL